MGWFDGVSVMDDRRHSSSGRHGSSSRKHSSSASFFGLGEGYNKHSSSRSSFFGGRSSSYYKRSPRPNFVSQTLQKLRRLLRDLLHYLKRNPMKVFMLVIMPLITGGALTGLLRQFGVRLPTGLERMFGAMGGGATGVGRGRNGEMQFEREKFEGPLGAMGGMQGLGSVLGVAKMFL